MHESGLFWTFGSSVIKVCAAATSHHNTCGKSSRMKRGRRLFKASAGASEKGFGHDSGCREERKSRPSQPFSTTIIEALFPQNTISVLLPQRRMTLNLAEFKCSPTCIRDRSVLLAMTSPSISGIPRARRSLPEIQLVYGLCFAHQCTLVLVKELQSAVAEPRICFQTVLYFDFKSQMTRLWHKHLFSCEWPDYSYSPPSHYIFFSYTGLD